MYCFYIDSIKCFIVTLVAFSMCWVFRFHMKASKRLTFYESVHTCQIENVFCFAVQTHAKHMQNTCLFIRSRRLARRPGLHVKTKYH